jgi:Fe-S-cluster containining protein
MASLEADLRRARDLDPAALADAVERIGFECTRCGACCKAEAEDPHTATIFPDEVRELQAAGDGANYDWRDVARPMPYGLSAGADGPEGETFEWALQTDACGDCAFYAEDEDGTGACTVHADRPLICETYPFSVVLGEDGERVGQPMGKAVSQEGRVRAHECEGLGRKIDRDDAEDLARALKERAIRELKEAIAVRENYEPADQSGVVVHDSEGKKRPDGTPVDTDAARE